MIALVAVGLVFGITLVLDGVSSSITNEVQRTVAEFHADSWLVPKGGSGPFTADHLAPQDAANSLGRTGSAAKAFPMFALTTTIKQSGRTVNVNIVGVSQPVPLSAGRWPRSDHEVVANDDLGVGIGQSITVSGRRFTVVGQTAHLRYFAGNSMLFMRLAAVQGLFVYGQPIASGFAVHGVLAGPPPKGLVVMTNAQVRQSLLNPVSDASSMITYMDVLLWIVAAGIIGTILYMTSLERLRDFAALKALGARTRQLVTGIGVQALVLSVASAAIAWVVAAVLGPFFPIPAEIPFRSYPLILVVAIIVGLLSSVAGVRKAIAIDPALAFGG